MGITWKCREEKGFYPYFILTYKKLTPQQLWKYCDKLLIYIYIIRKKNKKFDPTILPKKKTKTKKQNKTKQKRTKGTIATTVAFTHSRFIYILVRVAHAHATSWVKKLR